ncbi:Type I secretion outer membrane protein, TolC precursor [Candidatus Burkholderia verschuerenii]|uniref:Type I secretion outer membrane protein, TolC n=1 Tax=Candidatus Burkholderia verschuerenii TaxID=242163 RepID=A0A0L0MJN7_9BURK|nr:TolC family protein [Candidatus Burkholderia verschuerenii]KND62214.1 Type I secretion outer membrane protein, TolC precursor [Candidatus Burkholderia verschuerenii]
MQSMNKLRVSAWALAACCLFATTARADDLMTIVQHTLDYDKDVGQARGDFEAAKQAIPIARAALLPQIGGGWGCSYNEIKMDGFPRQHYWQNGWTVQATQPLFDWSKWTAYQQADYVAAQGTVKLAAAQQTAMLRAVRAYFDELAAEDELARTQDYLAAIDTQRDQIRKKRAAGEATLIDERDVDVAREQAQIQQVDAQQDLAMKRRMVQQVSGQPTASLNSLSGGTALPGVTPENPDVWADQARSSGYDVQAKQLEREIARMDSTKARAAHYPVVSVNGSYTPAGAASGYSRPTTTTTAMLQVMIPIYSGGEIQARLKQTLALEDKAEQALESAAVQSEGAARDSYATFLKARVRASSLDS